MSLQYIKDGVAIDRFSIQLLNALLQAAQIYQIHGVPLVITALSDGVHKDNSLHYRGYAADLRTRDARPQDIPTIVRDLRRTLGATFDVVEEGDHIHIEYDPQHDGGKLLP